MGKTAKIQSGVTIALDKMRTLKWTTEAKAEFEDAVCDWAKVKRGDPRYTTANILYQMGTTTRVLQLAMLWALHHEDDALDIGKVSKLIDDYKAKGNTPGQLIDALKEALEWADDPSSAPFFQKRLKSLQRLVKLQEEETDKERQKALKDLDEKIAEAEKKAKETGDGTPPVLEESS